MKGRKFLPVTEIYTGVQGEGIMVGTPCVFLRVSGCNLKCSWCDTKFSWRPKRRMLPSQVNKKLRNILVEKRLRNIVLTGGEPMLYVSLFDRIFDGFSGDVLICVETNGSIFHWTNVVDFWSVSPKIDKMNSLYLETLKRFVSSYNGRIQLKFLIDTKDDLKFVKTMFTWVPGDVPVIFQPLWRKNHSYSKKCQDVTKWCLGLDIDREYRVIPQVHKLIWGNRRKK